MSIHLYLGPAAGGKTAFVVARAREAARGVRATVTVCVANQLQGWAWRERLAGAGGALGVQVLTFGHLYRTILMASGQASTLLDDAMQDGLLRHTLGGAPLAHYASVRDKPGFVVLLHNLIAELKAARIDPQRLGNAVAELGGEPRLRELVWVYGAYQESLRANGWADEEELGWLALRALRDNPRMASDWSLLVVDGFDNLTTVQLDLVRLMAGRAGETIITLSGAAEGPERGLVQRRFLATRRTLEEALQVHAEPLPGERCEGDSGSGGGGPGTCQRRVAAALAHLERSLFVSQAGPHVPLGGAEPGHAVTLIAAADRRGEVRAALRWLKARLAHDGCCPAEVALLARQVAPYRHYVQETAREFGIPIKLLDGLPLASNPAVAALLDLLRLRLPLSAEDGEPSFPRRQVVEAWRSPYLDWGAANPEAGNIYTECMGGAADGSPPEEKGYAALADSLDSLARWGQVVGGLAQWREAFTRRLQLAAEEHSDEDLEWAGILPDADAVRALQEPFERFVKRLEPPTAEGIDGYVAWLEGLIGPEEKDDQEDEGCLRVFLRARQGGGITAERDVAALRALKDVLRGLVWAEQALGTAAPANYGAFYASLRASVEASVYRLPEGHDLNAVLVADVVQARGAPFRAVAVLGLAEGEFPLTLQEDPLLRDSDRRRLSALGLQLRPSTESAEAEYFYETLTRARDQLLLTRPRLAENGAIWEPSPYWEEVCRLTGARPEVLSSETRIRPDEAASWPELLEGLAAYGDDSPWHAWAREADAPRYWRWRLASEVFGKRYARRPSGPHNGDLSAYAAELGEIYGPQRVWSATRLESYRACPYSFFVGTVLGLEPRQTPAEGLDARSLGSIYHLLLQRTYEACPEDARNETEHLLAALEEVGRPILAQAPRREGFRETAWWLQTQEQILERVRQSLQRLAAMAEDMTPVRFEAKFDAVSVWESPDGQERLLLHGIVDRVDRCADGACRIIDYKTAGPWQFGRKALEEGKKLQLPLYALAMRKVWGGEIRDGFYWHVQQAEASPLRLQAYGVSQSMADALRFAREAVEGIRRGAFEPHPPAGGCASYCPAAAFCWSFRPMYGG